MAWAFVVEDGTGLATATSYVSVEEAATYFTPDPDANDMFESLTLAQQQYLLGWASRILDQKVDWRGFIATDEQAMRWPRTGVYDRDGRAVPGDVIPGQLKEAVFEMAKYAHSNDPTVQQDVDNLSLLRVDVIEIRWQEGTSQLAMPGFIGDIVYPLGILRDGSAGFPKIRKS